MLNVETQNADPDSVLNFYRAILAFRKEHPALIDGDIAFFKTAEPVLAFRRRGGGESLVCVYNLSPQNVKVTCDGDADILVSQAAERLKGKLTLGPNGWAIFSEREENQLRIDFKRRAKPSN